MLFLGAAETAEIGKIQKKVVGAAKLPTLGFFLFFCFLGALVQLEGLVFAVLVPFREVLGEILLAFRLFIRVHRFDFLWPVRRRFSQLDRSSGHRFL